jgi:hypothetical protein
VADRPIPFRKVQTLRGGSLLFNRRVGSMAPADENWWEGLLGDPRVRPKDHSARNYRDRLDQFKDTVINYKCEVCGWGASYLRKELMDSWGEGADAIELGRRLADCRLGKREGACSVRCVRRRP